MNGVVRKTDKKARLTLFGDFADQLVIVERLGNDEVRIKKARAVPRRYTLAELVAGITRENRHGEVDWGLPRGREEW
jgi:antitoxin component of MazEF toxin-antitoxin module